MLFDDFGPWYPNTFRLPTWANTYAVGQHSYIFDVRLRICWDKGAVFCCKFCECILIFLTGKLQQSLIFVVIYTTKNGVRTSTDS